MRFIDIFSRVFSSKHKAIELMTIIYLATPLLLFTAFWIKPYIAIPMIITIITLLVLCAFTIAKDSLNFTFRRPSKKILIVFLTLIIAWVAASGIGRINPHQTTDFNKHNAILNDLVNYKWPVVYETPEGATPLVYYTAYYLPSAFIGKIANSIDFAQFTLFLWSLIGVMLVFYWLARLTGGVRVLLVVLFVIFSGLDIIGNLLLTTVDSSPLLITRGSELEWYTGITNMQYSANTTALFWVPQHAISAWLLAGVIASIYVEKRSRKNIVFIASLAILWSPFVAIGLLPLLACLLLSKSALREAISIQNILALVTIVPLTGFYILSGNTKHMFGTFLDFSYFDYSTKKMVFILGLFIILEFGILAALLYRYVRHRESNQWFNMFISSVAFLTLLPLLRYGYFNDLTLRASAPALFIIFILTYRFITSEYKKFANEKLLIASCLAIGSIVPLTELNTHIITPSVDVNSWQSLNNPDIATEERLFVKQYKGSSESIYFMHVADSANN